MSFGMINLILLVNEELMKEAHEDLKKKEKWYVTASFFIGF